MKLGPLKPALTALVALLIFIVAFVAFILAPLLLAFIVCGGMWLYERWITQRRQAGIRAMSPARSLIRDAGTTRRDDQVEQGFGFGAGVGRDL